MIATNQLLVVESDSAICSLSFAISMFAVVQQLLVLLCLQHLTESATLTSSSLTAPKVGRYVIVDSTTNELLDKRLVPRNTINYNTLGTQEINVLFEVNRYTKSVLVTLDNPKRIYCESLPPYALFHNRAGKEGKPDRFSGILIPEGNRKITATPFDGPRCLGLKGEVFMRILHVQSVDAPALTIPNATNSPTSSPTPMPDPTFTVAQATSIQPRITTVESYPARKVAGVVDLPEGSPWCDGNPTYWLPGHKYENDTPNCYVNGNWTRPATAVFDNNDDLNDIDGPEVIDRHDCGTLDVNNDGRLDVYCLVGANSGRGEGYNELYLTQADGSLIKVKKHGLQSHNGLRGRYTTVLNGIYGNQYVFITTKGGKREDGKSNMHHMYRKTGVAPNYFEEVDGPFNLYSDATCAYKVDINDDGLDDVIMCNHKQHAMLFLQREDGSWDSVPWNDSSHRRQINWRKVRMADFTGDGIPDLLVAYHQEETKIRIFRGIRESPYVDFDRRFYEADLPFATPDLEVIDANGDGILDFYVVQSDEHRKEPITGNIRQETYCAGDFRHAAWWVPGNQPPADFLPPRDVAPDVLFLGMGANRTVEERFDQIIMEHSEPGCGNLVRPFGDQKLALAQGDFVRPGHNLILDWS